VDFYLDDQFEETARLKIVTSAAAPGKFAPDTGLSSNGLPALHARPTPSPTPEPEN
jgi:hypothetical protein